MHCKAEQRPPPASASRSPCSGPGKALFRGATPCGPRSAPSGRSARRLLRSGEWGDLAAERLKGEKFHVFRIKGLDPDPWGGRVNARNENPSCQTGSFRSRRVRALFDRVTGPKRIQLPKHPFSLAASSRIVQAKIPPRTCYQWPLPVAHKRIRTIRIMSCRRVGCRGRPRRGIPHMAKRATAHHSLLRLASVGLCNSGTVAPQHHLKTRGGLPQGGRPKAEQQDGMCLWSAWEVIGQADHISR